MSKAEVERFSNRFDTDAAFRQAVRADPEGTAGREHFDLDVVELRALRAIDWTKSDEQLVADAKAGLFS